MFEHFFPNWWRCWKVMGPLGGGDLLGDSRALLVAFDGLQPGPTFCLGSTSRMQMQHGQPASCSFLHSFPSIMDSHPYRTIRQKKFSLIPPPPSKENRTQPKVKPGAENLPCVIPQSALVVGSSALPSHTCSLSMWSHEWVFHSIPQL